MIPYHDVILYYTMSMSYDLMSSTVYLTTFREEKKQWGTITVHDSDSESDVEAKVRFRRPERERLQLEPGERVIFRAVPDTDGLWAGDHDRSLRS